MGLILLILLIGIMLHAKQNDDKNWLYNMIVTKVDYDFLQNRVDELNKRMDRINKLFKNK